MEKRIRFRKPFNTTELAVFTRRLATLLGAELPLVRSLEILIRQEKKALFKKVLIDLAYQVRSGSPFSESLARHSDIFDRLFVNMVKAGEASGTLDQVLARLAQYKERSINIRSKIITAMIYPSVVLFISGCIVLLLMLLVVPKFQQVYQDMLQGASLPRLTSFMIAASEFIQRHFIVFIHGVFGVGFFGAKFLSNSASGKHLLDWLWMHLPRVNDLVSKANIARFTRTLGMLLKNGTPVLEAFIITRDVIGNTYFIRALNRTHNRVRDGESIAASLEGEKVFSDMMVNMIDVGEETGNLAGMLDHIANDYDEDVGRSITRLTALIEPLMVVVLALVIGVLVVALFLPIVEMINKLN